MRVTVTSLTMSAAPLAIRASGQGIHRNRQVDGGGRVVQARQGVEGEEPVRGDEQDARLGESHLLHVVQAFFPLESRCPISDDPTSRSVRPVGIPIHDTTRSMRWSDRSPAKPVVLAMWWS